MRVLVLSWDVSDPRGGPTPGAAALASALADHGDRARLITRHPERSTPGTVPGVEVHAVPDAAPIIPLEVGGHLARVLAFSSRASTAAVRMLEQEAVDVAFIDGWQPTYAATAMRSTHEVPLVANITASWFTRRGPHLDDDGTLLHQIEWWLSYEARRIVSATPDGVADLARVLQIPATKLAVLPMPMEVPTTSPTPPKPDGPVLVVPPADTNDRAYLLAVRRHLADPPRLTTTWRSRPAAAVVLDDAGHHLAVRALASGVPLAVLDQPGLAGLVLDHATGRLVPVRDPEAVAEAIDTMRSSPDSGRAMAMHAVAQARITNDPETVVAQFRDIARDAMAAESGLQVAASPGRLRPVPPPGASI